MKGIMKRLPNMDEEFQIFGIYDLTNNLKEVIVFSVEAEEIKRVDTVRLASHDKEPNLDIHDYLNNEEYETHGACESPLEKNMRELRAKNIIYVIEELEKLDNDSLGRMVGMIDYMKRNP